jgi:hypothetical protein
MQWPNATVPRRRYRSGTSGCGARNAGRNIDHGGDWYKSSETANRDIKFDLVRPCTHCPFRSDRPFGLRRGRSKEIASAIFVRDRTFICHETTGDPGYTQHCAGALILQEKLRTGASALPRSSASSTRVGCTSTRRFRHRRGFRPDCLRPPAIRGGRTRRRAAAAVRAIACGAAPSRRKPD